MIYHRDEQPEEEPIEEGLTIYIAGPEIDRVQSVTIYFKGENDE